jgi:hypothetical protein
MSGVRENIREFLQQGKEVAEAVGEWFEGLSFFWKAAVTVVLNLGWTIIGPPIVNAIAPVLLGTYDTLRTANLSAQLLTVVIALQLVDLGLEVQGRDTEVRRVLDPLLGRDNEEVEPGLGLEGPPEYDDSTDEQDDVRTDGGPPRRRDGTYRPRASWLTLILWAVAGFLLGGFFGQTFAFLGAGIGFTLGFEMQTRYLRGS